MIPSGKGFFIWQIPNCENGDPDAIAALAQDAHFTHVLVKIADTKYSYNIYSGVDMVPPLVQALRARNIQVWGWHYVYGDDPVAIGSAWIGLTAERATVSSRISLAPASSSCPWRRDVLAMFSRMTRTSWDVPARWARVSASL